MMRNQILRRIALVILLAPPLMAAALDRSAAWRRRFMESRQARSLNGHAEPDPWADPASSFGHLPTKYMNPSGSKEADRIAALPGQPPHVDFRQYGGYVTVDEENGREVFYYFVESPSDAASKPLLLWFNSGPVCSSLGYGAMMELGPFRVNRDGKTLSRNEHAWNKVANVIFLEAPIGIGFSYSNTTSDYHHIGTGRAAMDMYFFMLHWLERFPEYKGRDFYIGGDGFAGRFAPKLASVIVASRKNTGKNPINLNGIFVGNPNLDVYKGVRGRLEFLWNHGVISDEHWTNITKHCSFSPYDNETQCYDALYSGAYQALYTANNNTDVFDWDNIYAPTCIKSPNGTSYSSSYLPGYDPCVDVDVYFNDHEVQKAIHARINTRWEACGVQNLTLNPNEFSSLSVVPTLSWLVHTGLRVWLYSGDMASMNSLTATRYSVKDLKLDVTKPWRPWYTSANEVGGFIQQYERGFTFASVRGAGQSVPSFQPKGSLVLFSSFLKGVLPATVSSLHP